jgi:hypothetical protein
MATHLNESCCTAGGTSKGAMLNIMTQPLKHALQLGAMAPFDVAVVATRHHALPRG